MTDPNLCRGRLTAKTAKAEVVCTLHQHQAVTQAHGLVLTHRSNRFRTRRHHPIVGTADQQQLGRKALQTTSVKQETQGRADGHNSLDPWVGNSGLVNPRQPTALEHSADVSLRILEVVATGFEFSISGDTTGQLNVVVAFQE